MKTSILALSLVLAGCAGIGSTDTATSTASASPRVQATPPTQNKGVRSELLSGIDLASEVGLSGYQLRARAVTIEPGGYTAAHTHQGRPTQEYVAQGTVIEVRNGRPIEHKAGAMVQGVNGVHHWWENHGTVPVVLVPVDIARP